MAWTRAQLGFQSSRGRRAASPPAHSSLPSRSSHRLLNHFAPPLCPSCNTHISPSLSSPSPPSSSPPGGLSRPHPGCIQHISSFLNHRGAAPSPTHTRGFTATAHSLTTSQDHAGLALGHTAPRLSSPTHHAGQQIALHLVAGHTASWLSSSFITWPGEPSPSPPSWIASWKLG